MPSNSTVLESSPNGLAYAEVSGRCVVGDIESDALAVSSGEMRQTRVARRASSSSIAMSDSPADITMLLQNAAQGDSGSLDSLMTAVYQDLRRLAISHMNEERCDHTLQPTALVHEAYLKLVDQRSTDWKSRLHFFAVASRIIRRILIDHARAHRADKRGGAAGRVRLDDQDDLAGPSRDIDLIALDEAMRDLAEIDEQQARIVELRYFGGCTVEEVAELLGIGRRTVDRDWQAAKTWLFFRLECSSTDPS